MLHPEEIVNKLKEYIGDGLLEWEVRTRFDGVTNIREQKHLYIKLNRGAFHRSVAFLYKISPLHISCPMASIESEEAIELIYPFMIYSGHGDQTEQPLIVSYDIPKSDLRTVSVTDIIPGIIIMERETQEMLGIEVENLPDERRIFTPDNMEEGFLPLRDKVSGISEE